jgi:hypothetical protein
MTKYSWVEYIRVTLISTKQAVRQRGLEKTCHFLNQQAIGLNRANTVRYFLTGFNVCKYKYIVCVQLNKRHGKLRCIIANR